MSTEHEPTSREDPPVLRRLREHPSAPRWNHTASDRLDDDDRRAVARFREVLATSRRPFVADGPPDWLVAWLAERRESVPAFARRIPPHTSIERAWPRIPTMSREDVATAPESLVPDDADLRRMIVYRTAGTTGHAMLVPHDARAAAMYQPLLEVALAAWGVDPSFGPGDVAAFLVGAQAHTVTYPCVLSAWSGAGFAKLNLHPAEWPAESAPYRYFGDLAPRLLTGDPITFAEMMRREIAARPEAIVTTAVAMSDALRARLGDHYGCPVIDWYSLTETGPVGYMCRDGGYHVVAPDLYVEVIDEHDVPLAAGERGEIALSGGRNPFLPLLRYRTGDFGRLEHAPCRCGDPMPHLRDLEGRVPVLFVSAAGATLNPVDVSRVLRAFPIVQHELVQRADRSCELTLRPIGGPDSAPSAAIERALLELFGDVALHIEIDPTLGDRADGKKVARYRSEHLLDD